MIFHASVPKKGWRDQLLPELTGWVYLMPSTGYPAFGTLSTPDSVIGARDEKAEIIF